MRKILYLCIFLFALPLTAQAQTTPSKKEPTKEVPKTEAPEEVEGSINLDKFFKKGEENAKKGSSCNKPATPVDPMA